MHYYQLGQKDLKAIQSLPSIASTDIQPSAPTMLEGQSDTQTPATYSETMEAIKGITVYKRMLIRFGSTLIN